LDNTLDGKDQELSSLRNKLKEWSESLIVKDDLLGKQRLQIQELKSKVLALEESKGSLKRTINESQNELENLVQVHEKLTQRQSTK
jgi:chromosome segregation ATPase